MLMGPSRLALLVNMHFNLPYPWPISTLSGSITPLTYQSELCILSFAWNHCFRFQQRPGPYCQLGFYFLYIVWNLYLVSFLLVQSSAIASQRTSIVLHLQVWRDKSNLHDPLELLQEYFDFGTVLEHILQGRHQLSRNCFCRKSKDCSFLHYVNFWNFIVFCILATIITDQDSNLNKTVALDTPLFCLESVDEIYRIPSIAIYWLSIKRNYAEVIHYNLDCSTEWSHKSQALNQ